MNEPYEVLQWLGRGQCEIEKVHYGYGRIIPHEKLDPAVLAEWKSKGLVGTIPTTRPQEMTHLLKAVDDYKVEVEALRKDNAAIKGFNEELQRTVAKLEKKLARGGKK